MLILLLLQGEVVMEKTAEKHLYEKPEERDVMININPKGKYDADVNVDTRVDESNAEKLSSRSTRPASKTGRPTCSRRPRRECSRPTSKASTTTT